eukprot:scaffold260_cov274-Pinguiococcus_pyrenoidosus.AAC.3
MAYISSIPGVLGGCPGWLLPPPGGGARADRRNPRAPGGQVHANLHADDHLQRRARRRWGRLCRAHGGGQRAKEAQVSSARRTHPARIASDGVCVQASEEPQPVHPRAGSVCDSTPLRGTTRKATLQRS